VSNSYHGAKGGDISIDAPGQHVIERSSVMVLSDGTVEARFNINLPARGRSICGDWAYTILVETLPNLVECALALKSLDTNHLWTHIRSVEDQEELRGLLKGAGLVGFIRDGAILPREVPICRPIVDVASVFNEALANMFLLRCVVRCVRLTAQSPKSNPIQVATKSQQILYIAE
jgi:predicted ABC-class ATPase